jgi:leishmanolysin-like peptidase
MQFVNSSSNGQPNVFITTPKVQAVVRNQFDCQSLIGAQLENQPTGTNICYGDHWDERQFNPEAMTAIISPTRNILSPLTLALMEDSGWYKANYTQSRLNPWGMGAGCDFYSDPCLIPSESSSTTPSMPSYSEGYFCTASSNRGCFADYTAKFACTVLDYNYILPKALPPTRFQYFPSDPTQGGPEQSDYCPVYESTYNGLDEVSLDCTNSASSPSVNLYKYVMALSVCLLKMCVHASVTLCVFSCKCWSNIGLTQ